MNVYFPESKIGVCQVGIQEMGLGSVRGKRSAFLNLALFKWRNHEDGAGHAASAPGRTPSKIYLSLLIYYIKIYILKSASDEPDVCYCWLIAHPILEACNPERNLCRGLHDFFLMIIICSRKGLFGRWRTLREMRTRLGWSARCLRRHFTRNSANCCRRQRARDSSSF